MNVMALLSHIPEATIGIPSKITRISTHLQDSARDRQNLSGQTKKPFILKLFTTKLVLFAIIGLSPLFAHAGFFSFFTDFLFAGDALNNTAAVGNSQNMALLKAAASQDPNAGRGGGDITIVGGSALLSEAGPSGTIADIALEKPTSDQISIYVVRPGDSLSQIAKMFNVTTNTIIWSNDIRRGSLITPGQQLVILPISGVQHLVKKGDTVRSITKKYKADYDEVLAYNSLTTESRISIGETITVPDGEMATVVYSSSGRAVRGTNGPTLSGYYIRPISGGRKSQGLHGYNAIDIAASVGTPIVASADGDVIVSRGSGWNGGYGSYIVIRHDNRTQTLYAHNSRNIVSGGQRVVKGQVIGYVGSTGKSTGPHLHFEIRGAKNPF